MPKDQELALRRLSRRAALRLGSGAAALLAAGAWPGRLAAGDGPDVADFTFICVNDLHYFDKNCDPFFQQMVNQMKTTGTADAARPAQGQPGGIAGKPDFCLVVGDLADGGTSAQLGAIRDHLGGLGMPAPVVVGNHDYINQGDRDPFEQLFRNQINYTFEHKGWQFVALDTTEGQHASGTSVPKETLAWLGDNVPKLDKKRPTILFTHFPMGFLTPCRPRNADAVLAPFKDLNLAAVFNGHYHGYTERTRWKATITTDKCCSFHHANHDGTKEKGYFLCRARDGVVERSFVQVKLA
jgi:3',5'-cyclic AMP phosphodiesterase CpdA